jgi:hypothetical protein
MKSYIKYIFRKIELFFLWSSGADQNILKEVPLSEKNKYFGIGGTIIFTAFMASFAGGYAFFTAFKQINEITLSDGSVQELISMQSYIYAAFFGIFWGALIFNLDRFIVSTFGVGDGKKTISKQEWIEATPRLLLAIVLGFVISTPLELKIFEKEIKVRVDRLKNEKTEELIRSDSTFFNNLKQEKAEFANVNANLNYYKTKNDELIIKRGLVNEDVRRELIDERNIQKSEVDRLDKIRGKARREYYTARNDSVPQVELLKLESKLQSIYNSYKIENEKLQGIEAKIDDLNNNKAEAQRQAVKDINGEIENLSNQRQNLNKMITELEKNANSKFENYKNTAKNYTGFAAHLEALESLTSESLTLLIAKWLITFLFIFIETAPILFKMMTERGPYDDICDRVKHEIRVRQLEIQSNINQEINTSIKVNTDKHEQKLSAELLSNKSILDAISKIQYEIAEVALQKWKEDQIQNIHKNGASDYLTIKKQ